MKLIEFSKKNDNDFIYVDNENYGNIAELKELSLLHTTNSKDDKHKFEQISYLYDSKSIVYTFREDKQHFLKILPVNSLINNTYMLDNIFGFFTIGNILKYEVSPNKNQIAIIFTAVDNYFDWINKKTTIGQRDSHKYFLNVYDVTQGNIKLLLNKRYPNSINIGFSEKDTIAISSYINERRSNPNDVSNLFEIYNLSIGKRVFKKVVDYSIEHINYFPKSEFYYNKLLIIAKDNDGEDTMRIINLEGGFAQMYIKNISPYYVMCIDITSNGEIALGTEMGLLYFSAFDQEPRILYNDIIVTDVSFSISGNNVALTYYDETGDNTEDNYGILIFNFPYNSELFNLEIMDDLFDEYILKYPQVEFIYSDDDYNEEETIVINDPILDRRFQMQHTNQINC
jgi:hypothetical protein